MYFFHHLNIPLSFCSSPSWLLLCSIFLCSSLTFPSTLPFLALCLSLSVFQFYPPYPPSSTRCVNPLLSTPSNNSHIQPSCSVTMDICSRLTSHAPLSVAFSLIFSFFFFFWHRPLSSLSFFLFFLSLCSSSTLSPSSGELRHQFNWHRHVWSNEIWMSVSLSGSFSSSISLPFAQKKRKEDPDEPPTAEQFPGMIRMFVPHRLPFAFHLRDRLSSWPPSPLLLLLLLFFSLFQHLPSSSIHLQRLEMDFRQRKKRMKSSSSAFPPVS